MMIGLQGPEVHFAMSDKLSLGVMATWIASPLALAAKYSFDAAPGAKTHFAAGTIVATSGYLLNAQGAAGLHWLTATRGDRSANVSLSLGYAYAYTGDWFSYSYNDMRYRPQQDGTQPYYYYYDDNILRAVEDQKGVDVYDNYLSDRLRGSYVIGFAILMRVL